MINRPRKLKLRYRGSKPQADFWSSKARIRFFVGGVGSGKTFGGCSEILKQPKKTAGMVMAPTYPMLRDATQRTFFEICPPALIKSHNESKNKTVLRTGVEIFWRSADRPKSLRGPNLTWLYVDEAAYVAYEAYRVGLGRLRRGIPRVWGTTTPCGLENWVYKKAVENPSDSTELFTSRTDQNKHNPQEYLDMLDSEFEDDPDYAAQETGGEFVDLNKTKRINGAKLALVYTKNPPLLVCSGAPDDIPGARFFVPPIPGERYVVGADPAEGVPGGDDSSVQVLNQYTGEQVACIDAELEPTEEFPKAIAAIARYYNNAWVLYENNNHGWALTTAFKKMNLRILKGPDGKMGWSQHRGPKEELYGSGAKAVADGARDRTRDLTSTTFRIYDEKTKKQLAAIDRKTLAHPGKKKGKTKVDDSATAWVLAVKACELAPSASWSNTAPSAPATHSLFDHPRGRF